MARPLVHSCCGCVGADGDRSFITVAHGYMGVDGDRSFIVAAHGCMGVDGAPTRFFIFIVRTVVAQLELLSS